MDILIISLAALAASALTLFSGFGLGTLLMPVVALFLPLEQAIAVTAVVHLANNLFKVALLGRYAVASVLLRFGVAAMIFAFLGALVLTRLADFPALFEYNFMGKALEVSLIKLLVGGLIFSFVLLEFSPRFAALSINKKYLPLGGAISGFFGGFSGHQGAFRSMFLLKAGLNKQQFIATGVMIAVLVDMVRLSIYGRDMLQTGQQVNWVLITVASLSAFSGAFIGNRLLKKLTIHSIQLLVSALLIVVALGLISGLI